MMLYVKMHPTASPLGRGAVVRRVFLSCTSLAAASVPPSIVVIAQELNRIVTNLILHMLRHISHLLERKKICEPTKTRQIVIKEAVWEGRESDLDVIMFGTIRRSLIWT